MTPKSQMKAFTVPPQKHVLVGRLVHNLTLCQLLREGATARGRADGASPSPFSICYLAAKVAGLKTGPGNVQTHSVISAPPKRYAAQAWTVRFYSVSQAGEGQKTEGSRSSCPLTVAHTAFSELHSHFPHVTATSHPVALTAHKC